MRSIASCYSDHAVKVSDSYCSGPSHLSYLTPKLTPSIPHSVSSTYRINLSTQNHFFFFIKFTWTQTMIGRGFIINIGDKPTSFTKSNSNHRKMQTKKGTETFRFRNSVIQLLWDLSAAEYDPGPEPNSGFYLVVMVDSQIALFLGDKVVELQINSVKTEDSLPKLLLISRVEQFYGNNSVYCTKAEFSGGGMGHEIMIKCGGEEEGLMMKRSVLLVFIDKKKMFEVNRLKWNFRGNQTIFVDGLLVDMMWDVHDWLFNEKSGCAVFLFRTRSGLNSRLWLEEKVLEQIENDRVGFSLLISACKNPD